ncbi:MAG: molybdenum cofactor guanylyltransferase [Phormidesmis sp.]
MALISDLEPLPALSAIILAGGRSRRMGHDKALLTLPDGRPLLHRTAQIAQQLATDVVVVTPWSDRYRSALPPQVRLIHETTAPGKAAGPLSGFAEGLKQISSDWCLLLACDMPYLQSAPLQQWWAWIQRQTIQDQTLRDQAIMASLTHSTAAAHTKRWEPLCGFYHCNCQSALEQYLSSPCKEPDQPQHNQTKPRARLSFQSWLTTLAIAPYSHLPKKILFNCNTPDDWASVHQALE